MKKITVFAAFALLAIGAASQEPVKPVPVTPALRETYHPKHDTVTVPVLYFQVSDTTKMSFVYQKGTNLKIQKGYVVYKGWKNQGGAWVKQPDVNLYTLKWKPFKEKVISANQ